ncbi:MAG TPA: AI-2E family transporter [Bacteroidota bacterium]|nr:AI-2E family transporter [Bacteroidota bacterium]
MTPNKPLIKVTFILSLIIICLIVASFFPELVFILILSVLFALVLEPFVHFLEYRAGLKRIFAVLISFVVVGGILTFGGIEFVPIALDRAKSLYGTFQTFPFDEKLQAISRDISSLIPFFNAGAIHEQIISLIHQAIEQLGKTVEESVGFLANLIIAPFITFFILMDGDKAIKKGIELIPNKYFEMTLNVFFKLKNELSAYLKGLFLESSTVGILNIIAFLILGIPYAIVIGVCAGIANIVPYFGPVVGATLAIIISFVYGGSTHIILNIIIASLLIRLIDDVVLQPLCFGRTLKMHPVAVVFILLIGNQLLGIVGMVISIPIATILRVSASETYWGFRRYSITA